MPCHLSCRKRNNITSRSKLSITTCDADLYLANIDDRLIVKLGPRFDLGDQLPKDGWKLAEAGQDFAIWERA